MSGGSAAADRALTAIVVAFRPGPALGRCLAAVLAEAAVARLILVNNGAWDDLAPWRAALTADARVRLIEGQGNIGFGRAVNLAAERVESDVMLVLNPDCILPDHGLDAAVAKVRADRTLAILGARVCDAEGREQRGARRRPVTPVAIFSDIGVRLGLGDVERALYQHEAPWEQESVDVGCCSGAFLLMRTACFRALKGFDPGYFLHVEDVDLCWRAGLSGLRVCVLRDLVVTHIGGTSDVPGYWLEWQKIRGWSRYFTRHFRHGPQRWLAPFALALVVGFHLAVMARRAVRV